MGRPLSYWERGEAATPGVRVRAPRPKPLSDKQKLLVGYLAGLSWGSPPRSSASWRGVVDRGLAEIVQGNPPTTELTSKGRQLAATLDREMALRQAVERG